MIKKIVRWFKKEPVNSNKPDQSWAETSANMKKRDPLSGAIATILDDMDRRYGKTPEPSSGKTIVKC